MKPELQDHITTLRAYHAWRTGADTRTLGGAGIIPADIAKALNAVLDFAENHLRDATKMIEPVKAPSDEAIEVIKLALEYWSDRQQRYKNRAPVWVQDARALLEKHTAPKLRKGK